MYNFIIVNIQIKPAVGTITDIVITIKAELVIVVCDVRAPYSGD